MEAVVADAGASRLIFDVGMHEAQNTAYYLSRGFRVVALDADPRLAHRALQLLPGAVQDR